MKKKGSIVKSRSSKKDSSFLKEIPLWVKGALKEKQISGWELNRVFNRYFTKSKDEVEKYQALLVLLALERAWDALFLWLERLRSYEGPAEPDEISKIISRLMDKMKVLFQRFPHLESDSLKSLSDQELERRIKALEASRKIEAEYQIESNRKDQNR